MKKKQKKQVYIDYTIGAWGIKYFRQYCLLRRPLPYSTSQNNDAISVEPIVHVQVVSPRQTYDTPMPYSSRSRASKNAFSRSLWARIYAIGYNMCLQRFTSAAAAVLNMHSISLSASSAPCTWYTRSSKCHTEKHVD